MIDRVTLLLIRNEKLLTARSRGKKVFYLPGGKRENGESDLETLLRETREELGANIRPGSEHLFGIFCGPAHAKPEGVQVRLLCYRAETEGTLFPCSEVEELRWQGMEMLSEVPPADVQVYRALFEQGLIR